MFQKRRCIWALGCAVALTPLACGDDSDNRENKTDTTADNDTGTNDTGTGAATDTDTGGRGTDSEGVDSESETAEDLIIGQITIPPEFDGVPVQLSMMFFSVDSEGGMPDAFGDVIANPEVVAGEVFPFTTTQAGLEGEYYLSIILS